MAQKARKVLSTRNTTKLKQTHIITIAVHSLYILLRFLSPLAYHRHLSLKPYLPLSIPALVLEFYLERLGRPTYHANGDLRSAGEDLDAKGLTEWMWDVVYWTWGCIAWVCLVGNGGWWLWIGVPVYSAYAGYTGVMGAKKGLTGIGTQGGGQGQGGESKRQKKMEKRGGKVQYR